MGEHISPSPQGAPRLCEARGIENEIAIVCVGDSLTGYNNSGDIWPLPTYPDFLQEMLEEDGRPETLVNGGQAGECSEVAAGLTQQYLALFPRSTHFIIGFGTNDLGGLDETGMEVISATIIRNLGRAFDLAQNAGKRVLAFNVPHLNASRFGKGTAARSRRIREYHNRQLAAFCATRQIPLADICSQLKDEHFADPLHPNDAGARIIAESLYADLVDML